MADNDILGAVNFAWPLHIDESPTITKVVRTVTRLPDSVHDIHGLQARFKCGR